MSDKLRTLFKIDAEVLKTVLTQLNSIIIQNNTVLTKNFTRITGSSGSNLIVFEMSGYGQWLKYKVEIEEPLLDDVDIALLIDKSKSLMGYSEGDIEIRQRDNSIFLKSKKNTTKFQTVDTDLFSLFPENNMDYIELDVKEFQNVIKKLGKVCPKIDSGRFNMKGILFEDADDKIAAYGCDGQQVMKMGLNKMEDDPFVLDRTTLPLTELSGMNHFLGTIKDSTFEISFGEKIFVRSDKIEFAINLLSGKFPNVQLLIDKSAQDVVPTIIKFDNFELLDSLNRLKSATGSHKCNLVIEKNTLTLSAAEQINGIVSAEDIEIETQHFVEKWEIAVFIDQFIRVLTDFEFADQIDISSERSPIRFVYDDLIYITSSMSK